MEVKRVTACVFAIVLSLDNLETIKRIAGRGKITLEEAMENVIRFGLYKEDME